MTTTNDYTDGTYKYLGSGEFERYDREALGYWVSSTSRTASTDEGIATEMLNLVYSDNAEYVGIWTADNGDRYVDKSHYVRNREVAEAAGRYWKQEAIWDISKGEAIYL